MENLLFFRLLPRISPSEMADLLETSRSQILMAEKGERFLPTASREIVDALQAKLSELCPTVKT